MNTAIELHDSELLSMRENNHCVVMDLIGYLHMSKGRPGKDVGSVWQQSVRLTFSGIAELNNPHRWPDTILDGTLTLGESTFENLFPVATKFDGPCRMVLEFANDLQLVITGSNFRTALLGEPSFIETFEA